MNRAIAVLTCIALAGCAGDASEDNAAEQADSSAISAPAAAPTTASAPLRDATGRDLGALTITEDGQGLAISGTVNGIPAGTHGIHLHTVGSCTGPRFESAGDHWNPDNKQHGFENAQGPHRGDLPNLVVEADSALAVQFSTRGGTLSELLDADGAALVIHAKADDLRTDPSGDSGDRIACAVITR